MRQRLFKMLLNAADSGGASGAGGGNAAPAAGASPAQGTPAPSVPSLDQIKGLIGEQVGELKNGLFAEFRRSGLLGKDKAGDDGKAGAGAAGAGTSPAPGLTSADVDKLVNRATAFERIATETKLTDSQRKRMDAAMRAENPDDVAGWSKSYLEDLGIVKAATANPQPNTQSSGALRPGLGSSDRGAPTRDTSLAHEGAVWKMTAADVASLIREKGFQAAGHELRTRMKQDLRGAGRILFPRPGG